MLRQLGYYGILGLFLVMGLPPAAHAGLMTISDLIGGVHVQPTSVQSDLTRVWDVESHDGILYAAGEKDGKAAYQTFDLGTGVPVAGQVQVLASPNPNNPHGAVNDVAVVNGQVTFVGKTVAVNQVAKATYWGLAGHPTTMSTSDPLDMGLLYSASPSGLVVGEGASNDAIVGKLGGPLQVLPAAAFSGSTGISDDGKWIVGNNGFTYGLWHTDTPDAMNYNLQDLTLQANLNGDLPNTLRSVVLDPVSGHYVAFGDYTDSVTISDSVAAWDLSDGSLLRDFGAGALRDVRLFGDSVVVDINGLDFGYLTTLHTSETMPISDLLGPDAVFSTWGGLFEGSLGVFALGGDGTSVTVGSFEVNGVSSVPEPSSWLMMLLGLIMSFIARHFGWLRHCLPRRH
jgi:hypothetical protein